MSLASYIFGIVPTEPDGDYVSATCLENAVWLRVYDGSSYYIQKAGTGSQWIHIAVDSGSQLARAVVKAGGDAFTPFEQSIGLLVGSALQQLTPENLADDNVLYLTAESGCDEIPFENGFEGGLLVYRATDPEEGLPQATKAGEAVDLPGLENDPESEAVVLLKA